MSNGFGPLLPNLDPIRYEGREYWLGSVWTSGGDWVEIGGLDATRSDGGPAAVMPREVARKIAAAILYAEVYEGLVGPAEPLSDVFTNGDPAAFTQVLKHILADELADTSRGNTGMNTQPHQCKCDRCDRPLRDFIQVDGWANMKPGDSMMVPDSDGDVVMSGRTREPQRSGTTVRILVAADAEHADVLRVIRKQLDWMESDPLVGISADGIDAELFSEWTVGTDDRLP
jgi:hypothetical protein